MKETYYIIKKIAMTKTSSINYRFQRAEDGESFAK